MSHLNTNSFALEGLENRTLLSVAAAPTVVGYLPDYRYASLHSAGSQTLDHVNWGALTQINYFSVVPDGTLSSNFTQVWHFNSVSDIQAKTQY